MEGEEKMEGNGFKLTRDDGVRKDWVKGNVGEE